MEVHRLIVALRRLQVVVLTITRLLVALPHLLHQEVIHRAVAHAHLEVVIQAEVAHLVVVVVVAHLEVAVVADDKLDINP